MAAVIVGLVSCYLEGPLVRGAVESALEAADHVLVFEGPAGEPLDDKRIPPSELPYGTWSGVDVVHGTWRTDAKKRTAMIEACRRFEPPVWGVWVDGDEILVNARYLRDWLRVFDWRDELTPDAPATLGWPLKLVELDGGVVVCRGKCVRVDLIDSYSVSSSVFRTVADVEHGEGNVPFDYPKWAQDRAAGFAEGRLYLRPPLPCEPFLLHRSALRHPLRLGLRLHEQEAVELEKAKGLQP